jgi:glycosyltransferase involved in cell wall biosynthesis
VHTNPRRNGGIRRLTQAAIRESSAVFAVSTGLAQQIEDLATPAEPVRVIYRGVDFDRFSPAPPSPELRARLGLPTTGVGICTVARLTREKGVFELLGAFEQLARDFPSLWLALVGDGPLRTELERLIRSRGLTGRVFLAGDRPHTEVPEWMRAADVFVLASHNEGLPNVVLEAMACGRAVVATTVGGVPEAVEDEVTGILVPPDDQEHLGQAIRRLLDSEALRTMMATRGRERVLERFSWPGSTATLIAGYRDVLRRSASVGDEAAA